MLKDNNKDGYLDILIQNSEYLEYLLYEFDPKENKFKDSEFWYEGIEKNKDKAVISDLEVRCESKELNFKEQDSVGICLSAFAEYDAISLSFGNSMIMKTEKGHKKFKCFVISRKEIKSLVEIDINGIHYKKQLPKCKYNFIDIYLAENHEVQVVLLQEKPIANILRQPPQH